MSDAETTIRDLRLAFARFRDERAWKPFHTPRNLVLGLVSEVGELAELLRWRGDEEVPAALEDPEFRTRFADEVADVTGFLLLLCDAANLDLSEAVLAKLEKNALKYPVELARGRATKYTEL